MQGATTAIAVTVLLLVALVTSLSFFSYFNRLRAEMVSSGEERVAELEVPPKLISLVCYSGYGYMYLSPSQGQREISGRVLLTVYKDTGELVKEKFIDLSLSGPEKLYLPVFFNTSERYLVLLSARKWRISEYCSPINDPNMVLYLPFDEGSGSTAGDDSDYENDCTISGGSWGNGVVGGALVFDGSSTFVDCGSDEDFNSTDFTVSAWVRPNDLNSNHSIWGGFNPGGDHKNYVWVDAGDDVRTDQSPPGGGVLNSSNAYSSQWFHVVVVRNSTRLAVYLNGSMEASTGTVENYAGAAITKWAVGYRYSSSPSAYFAGRIDELRVYSRALNPDEVEALYMAYV